MGKESKMEKIQSKIESIVKNRFAKEWEEVKKKYPLVAAITFMQDPEISGSVWEAQPVDISHLASLTLQQALNVRQINRDTATKIRVRHSHAFRMLERDLGRATSAADVESAFDAFGRRFRGELEEVPKCTKCNGTGRVDGDRCSSCDGEGYLFP